jgi:RNA polymerase sigma-70 factor, ECF subfamily
MRAAGRSILSMAPDPKAFSTLLIAELPYLRRFARSLAGDAALADDLVQDTAARAIEKQHLYDPARPLRAWLYAILRNLFINGIRKRKQFQVVKNVDDLVDGEDAVAPEQEQGLSLKLIADAMARLPEQHREVIALVSLEEMSYRDVSEILGVPMGTVMSRLSRAREQLRTILENRGTSVLRRVK